MASFTCCQLHVSPVAHVASCTRCHLHLLPLAHVATCTCNHLHVLPLACVALFQVDLLSLLRLAPSTTRLAAKFHVRCVVRYVVNSNCELPQTHRAGQISRLRLARSTTRFAAKFHVRCVVRYVVNLTCELLRTHHALSARPRAGHHVNLARNDRRSSFVRSMRSTCMYVQCARACTSRIMT